MSSQLVAFTLLLLVGQQEVFCKYIPQTENNPDFYQKLEDVSKTDRDENNIHDPEENSNIADNEPSDPSTSFISEEIPGDSSDQNNTVAKSANFFNYHNPYSSNFLQNYYYPQHSSARAPSASFSFNGLPISRPYLDTQSPSVVYLGDDSSEEHFSEEEDNLELPSHELDRSFHLPLTLPAPPVLTGAETYNTEGSEIGDSTYIVPEELEGLIALPLDEPAQKTYGLTINDGNVLRKEVRNDRGEFSNSYITADGTKRLEIGELVTQPNGGQILVLRGSYTYKSPDGTQYKVIYKADEKGYHTKQVPVKKQVL